MMLAMRLALASLVLLLATATPVKAEMITFAGTISNVYDPAGYLGGVSLPNSFNGSYSYNSSIGPNENNNIIYDYLSDFSMTVTIGPLEFKTVAAEYGYIGQMELYESGNHVLSFQNAVTGGNSISIPELTVGLYTDTMTFAIIGANWFTISGSLDSIGLGGSQQGQGQSSPPPTSNPEPSSLALFSMGIIGMTVAGVRRRRLAA